MTQVNFRFDPTGPGASEDLADRLERVFGAARWVHNRAMIRQWEEIQAGRVPPSLQQLIVECIDTPAKEQDTSWLLLVPRGVLIDELEDLVGGWSDLKDIRLQRHLPLKTKKEDQEIIFPENSFTLVGTEDGFGIILDKTGQFVIPIDVSVPTDVKADAVKIERSTYNNSYKATVYFI